MVPGQMRCSWSGLHALHGPERGELRPQLPVQASFTWRVRLLDYSVRQSDGRKALAAAWLWRPRVAMAS